MAMQGDVMVVKEVAAYLRVHPSSIRRLLRLGIIPSFRTGSDHRFLRSEIDKWMEEKSAATRVRTDQQETK